MNNFPIRPRVAHGLGKMLAQSQLLPDLSRSQSAQMSEQQDAEAMAALQTLIKRLERAENTVNRIQLMVCALQEQCDARPADDLARIVCETVLTGIKSALDAEDAAARKQATEGGDAANAGG